jgi:PilZ domain-containing protein
MALGKENRKHTRVRPRGVVAHVRAPTSAFACQVENLSAGGLFLRTEQQLPRGTPLQIDLVKPGGRKGLRLAGLVAGAISAEEAAVARFIPGLGVQFTDVGAEEADRLEGLLTALGVDPPQAVVAPELRRLEMRAAIPGAGSNRGGHLPADPEAILRDISEALGTEEAPLATAKPALPPQPAGPLPAAADAQLSEPARLMGQIRGLLFELADAQQRLKQREAEVQDLRAQLDDARAQIEELQSAAGRPG